MFFCNHHSFDSWYSRNICALAPPKTVCFEVRDLWPELPKAMGVIRNPLILGAMSILEWISYHSAHRLIGLSPGIVHGINSRGIAPKRIESVPNGCDIEIFGKSLQPWRPMGILSADFWRYLREPMELRMGSTRSWMRQRSLRGEVEIISRYCLSVVGV